MIIDPIKASKNQYYISRSFDFCFDNNSHHFIAPCTKRFFFSGKFHNRLSIPHIIFSLEGTIILICQITLNTFDFQINIDKLVLPLICHKIEAEYIKNHVHTEYYSYDYNEQMNLENFIKEEIFLHIPIIPKKM
jgi:hypothetical protein